MGEVIIVGAAEIKCATDRGDILVARGLGSGISVCAYDPESQIAAMANVPLPLSNEDSASPRKYADTAIPLLLQAMVDRGAAPDRIRAAVTGGAQLFNFKGPGVRLEVGARNVEAIRAGLERASLPVVSADLGGTEARTVQFTSEGQVQVNVTGKGDFVLVDLGK